MKKSKGIAVALVMCFVAVVAVTGITTLNRYESRLEQEQANAGEETKDNNQVAHRDEVIDQMSEAEQAQITNTEQIHAELNADAENNSEDKEVNASENIVAETPEKSQTLTFSTDDTLLWPVDGNVVLNYSMDQTIYFPTLDQYKYNPALLISGGEGNPVQAATAGKVTSIQEDAQTGNTITVDIGSGYELTYGQLQEIRVIEGERIEQGDVIGYLSMPTIYYSVEGCNLYFKMTQDGEPVNPLDYMEE